MEPNHKELDDLVARSAPRVAEASDADLRRAWNRIEPTVVTTHQVRRRRLGVVAGTVCAALAIGGVASADFWSARTGQGPIARLVQPSLSAPDVG